MQFPVVLHTDDGTHYGVIVPDLPGCFSGGNGIDDALAEAREGIDFHLECLLEEGGEIPLTAGSIAQHQHNPDFAGGLWAMVDVDMSRFAHIPNALTAETLQKSECGEDVHHSDNANTMFRDLGI